MAEVYYYVPVEDSDYVIECGLKLSRWFDKEVVIQGKNKKCFSALLNPKDDMEKFNDKSLRCIKLDPPPEYCYVADKYLYKIGLNIPEVIELYYSSIIPIKNYIFGIYRLPECLVTTTAIQGQTDLLNKAQDIPVLFNYSEELYINNLMESNKETYECFEDMILYCFYSRLAEEKIMRKIEDKKTGVALFFYNDNKIDEKAKIIKIPKSKLIQK